MTETTRVDPQLFCDATEALWTVSSATFVERLNHPYALHLTLMTDDMDAEPVRMLGQPATLTLARGSLFRQITGIIREVVDGTSMHDLVTTSVVVVPAYDALRHRVNTKIFQEKTVPEILEEVLGEGLGAYGRSFDNRLTRAYRPCDYRVQYDESDFSFCQRLMQEEGILCWFEHDGDAELLVLADDALA
jgi:type VI secretion system secreted protein VgrG